MEFNEKTGQTAVMKDRVQPGKYIDQTTVHTGLALFISLSAYFPACSSPNYRDLSLSLSLVIRLSTL